MCGSLFNGLPSLISSSSVEETYSDSNSTSTVTPLFDMSDIVLSAILVSVIEEENIEKVKAISQSHGLFGLDLKKTIQDKENPIIQEDTNEPQQEKETEEEEDNPIEN